jgi:predicted metalloprotease
MRWRQSKESQNVEDYRGRSTGVGRGGKIGIVGIVAVIGAYFLGIDPRLVMGLLGDSGAPAQAEAPVESGAPTDERGSFAAHILGDTDETWTKIFSQSGMQYRNPHLALFDNAINTGCGTASSAAGPFYCPPDQRVYIDLAFFQQLETEFAAQGDFAKAYVIGHEVGHHVQNLLGTADKVRAAQQQASEAEVNALSVKLELQADCFAGIWAHDSDSGRQLIEDGDINEALTAASSVGDDTIQKRVQGHVNQETFTHGSGADRQMWFRKGYSTGRVQDCNTFQ